MLTRALAYTRGKSNNPASQLLSELARCVIPHTYIYVIYGYYNSCRAACGSMTTAPRARTPRALDRRCRLLIRAVAEDGWCTLYTDNVIIYASNYIHTRYRRGGGYTAWRYIYRCWRRSSQSQAKQQQQQLFVFFSTLHCTHWFCTCGEFFHTITALQRQRRDDQSPATAAAGIIARAPARSFSLDAIVRPWRSALECIYALYVYS